MPTLSIDDKQLTVPENTTILKAAQSVGADIPTICYHDHCTANGLCRMCVVEVEGTERPVTACNTVALDGMRVLTDTPRVRSMREEVMKLILMDHPLECPTCPAGGEGDIQNITYSIGIYST